MIAAIRVRAGNPSPKVAKTLSLLRLNHVNHCILADEAPPLLGMVRACGGYIAWGTPSDAVVKKMEEKRGEEEGKAGEKREKEKEGEEKKGAKEKKGRKIRLFRLHPPKKGWGGIKKPYPLGALGKRSDIDELLMRMI